MRVLEILLQDDAIAQAKLLASTSSCLPSRYSFISLLKHTHHLAAAQLNRYITAWYQIFPEFERTEVRVLKRAKHVGCWNGWGQIDRGLLVVDADVRQVRIIEIVQSPAFVSAKKIVKHSATTCRHLASKPLDEFQRSNFWQISMSTMALARAIR